MYEISKLKVEWFGMYDGDGGVKEEKGVCVYIYHICICMYFWTAGGEDVK